MYVVHILTKYWSLLPRLQNSIRQLTKRAPYSIQSFHLPLPLAAPLILWNFIRHAHDKRKFVWCRKRDAYIVHIIVSNCTQLTQFIPRVILHQWFSLKIKFSEIKSPFLLLGPQIIVIVHRKWLKINAAEPEILTITFYIHQLQ